MSIVLVGLMVCLLVRAQTTMAAASAACRLFVTAVLPGLFPYMVLSLMLMSRLGGRIPGWGMVLLGWGGGSPTGARLLKCVELPRRQRIRLAVTTATMSPMFLLGTVGGWLGSAWAGLAVLASVLLGGFIVGGMAGACVRREEQAGGAAPPVALTLGQAIDQAARTMLLVCGAMVMLRVLAALASEMLPGPLVLPITTLMEVTTGTAAIAEKTWPLALRTAVIAGATGFGGLAILMQNRAVAEGLMPLWQQVLWQAVHGAISFLLALGLMLL